jgi:hypothetical protein
VGTLAPAEAGEEKTGRRPSIRTAHKTTEISFFIGTSTFNVRTPGYANKSAGKESCIDQIQCNPEKHKSQAKPVDDSVKLL